MRTGFLLVFLFLQNADDVLTRIGIDQKLKSRIDSNISFKDEAGSSVRFGDYLGRKAIILTPVYYECPMLCGLELNGLVKSLRAVQFLPGNDFEIVTFSIDPSETPALARAKKNVYVRQYGRPGAQEAWHFLTANQDSIKKLTSEIGFRYTYDAYTKQWAHASVLIVLTPDGHISKYFNGVEYDPEALRLSLVEASNGGVGTLADTVILSCFRYNPTTGKYDLAVLRLLRISGTATIIGIALMIASGLRKRSRRRL